MNDRKGKSMNTDDNENVNTSDLDATQNHEHEDYDISDPYNLASHQAESAAIEPVGIKGWLIIVAIGRILAPIILLYNIFIATLPLYTSGMIDELSNPANDYYSPLWKPLVMFELVGNILFLVLNVVLLYWFFAKKKKFIAGFIATILASLIFNLFDIFLMMQLQSTYATDLGLDYPSVIIGPVVNFMIWVPYVLKSLRVKNTFVH